MQRATLTSLWIRGWFQSSEINEPWVQIRITCGTLNNTEAGPHSALTIRRKISGDWAQAMPANVSAIQHEDVTERHSEEAPTAHILPVAQLFLGALSLVSRQWKGMEQKQEEQAIQARAGRNVDGRLKGCQRRPHREERCGIRIKSWGRSSPCSSEESEGSRQRGCSGKALKQ